VFFDIAHAEACEFEVSRVRFQPRTLKSGAPGKNASDSAFVRVMPRIF
jgi:hypothetical protein